MRLFLLPLLALLLLPTLALAKVQMLDRIVAVVNDGVITQSQLDERLNNIRQQSAAAQQQLPPADVLQQQVLKQMIMHDIQLQLAKRAGIKIDDQTLNNSLIKIAKSNHLTLSEFAAKVRGEGMDWSAFRRNIRDQVAIGRLRQSEVGRQVHVSDSEIDQFLASALGKKLFSYDLHLKHIVIPVSAQASAKQVDAAQKTADKVEALLKKGANFSELAMRYSGAEDALKGGDLGWRHASALPSLYTQAAADLSAGAVSQPLKAGNGFHIIKLVERRGNSGKQIVKQYQVRHILIKSSKLRTPAEAQALAQKLHNEVKNGKSFAKLAKEFSDDPGSGAQGGKLGWVSPGQMVPSFDKEMQTTPVGTLSPVFHSRYGWHFLEVDATRNADMSKQYKRTMAANALHQRYFEEQLQLWLQKIRAEAYVDIRQ